MHCPECNASIHVEALFCHRCGYRIDPENVQEKEVSESEDPSRATSQSAIPGGASAGGVSNHPNEGEGQEEHRQPSLTGERKKDAPEEHLWSGSYSGKAMIGSMIIVGLITLLLLVGAIFLPPNGWTWSLAIGLILLIWLFLGGLLVYRRMNASYELTSRRFIHQIGILRRVTDRIETIDIDDVNYEQGILDRFVGVGTIRITSSDRSHPVLVLLGIDGVKDVSETIDSARRKERERRGLYIESV